MHPNTRVRIGRCWQNRELIMNSLAILCGLVNWFLLKSKISSSFFDDSLLDFLSIIIVYRSIDSLQTTNAIQLNWTISIRITHTSIWYLLFVQKAYGRFQLKTTKTRACSFLQRESVWWWFQSKFDDLFNRLEPEFY